MREGMRRVLAALVAVAGVFAVAALSRLPYGVEDRERAVLRLSWRTIGERVEECRPLTPEEESRLPLHMRPREICEGRIAPYALTVWVDGEEIVRDTIHGAGAREDRPIYVFREIELSPGAHDLRVVFRSLLGARKRAAVEFEEKLRVRPSEIVLVTYDAGGDDWIVRRSENRP